jgi:hypothetical protein
MTKIYLLQTTIGGINLYLNQSKDFFHPIRFLFLDSEKSLPVKIVVKKLNHREREWFII